MLFFKNQDASWDVRYLMRTIAYKVRTYIYRLISVNPRPLVRSDPNHDKASTALVSPSPRDLCEPRQKEASTWRCDLTTAKLLKNAQTHWKIARPQALRLVEQQRARGTGADSPQLFRARRCPQKRSGESVDRLTGKRKKLLDVSRRYSGPALDFDNQLPNAASPIISTIYSKGIMGRTPTSAAVSCWRWAKWNDASVSTWRPQCCWHDVSSICRGSRGARQALSIISHVQITIRNRAYVPFSSGR